MTPILPRLVEDSLARTQRVMPVTVVAGSRQTGKSTLVRNAPSLRDYPYLSLDVLHDGPHAFWLTDRVLATPWWKVL